MFTGRRVDILDDGSLTIQYNRNRYYDQYTGRWLTHDPLGITPNPQWPNRFAPTDQYKDGSCVYEYQRSEPVSGLDAYGLFHACGWDALTAKPKCGSCGPDVTLALIQMDLDLTWDWYVNWDSKERKRRCNLIKGANALDAWDIEELHGEMIPGGTCDCKNTVVVHGGCYCVHEVNYFLWGRMNKLCGRSLWWTKARAHTWAAVGAPVVCAIGGLPCVGEPESKANFAVVGYTGDFRKLKPWESTSDFCKVSKPPRMWGGRLEYKWE